MKDLESESGTSFVCVGVFLARWALDLLTVTWLMERHFTAESFHGLWSHFRNLTLFSSERSCGLIAVSRADGEDISARTFPWDESCSFIVTLKSVGSVQLRACSYLFRTIYRVSQSHFLPSCFRHALGEPYYLITQRAEAPDFFFFLKWRAGEKWFEVGNKPGNPCERQAPFVVSERKKEFRWDMWVSGGITQLPTCLRLTLDYICTRRIQLFGFRQGFCFTADLIWLDSHFSLYPERTGKLWCHEGAPILINITGSHLGGSRQGLKVRS